MADFGITSYPVGSGAYRAPRDDKAQFGHSNGFRDVLAAPDMRGEAQIENSLFEHSPIVVKGLSPIRLTDLIAKNPSAGKRFAELPEADFQAYLQEETANISRMKASLEGAHSQPVPPDPTRYPELQTYASIIVNDQVVATIDNQGIYKSSPDIVAKVSHLLPNEAAGGNGPNLAQARAEIMAKALAGKVVKAETVLSQPQFLSLPEYRQEWTLDHAAMLNDPAYQQIEQAQTRLDTLQKDRADYLKARA